MSRFSAVEKQGGAPSPATVTSTSRGPQVSEASHGVPARRGGKNVALLAEENKAQSPLTVAIHGSVADAVIPILLWAAQRQVQLAVTVLKDGSWRLLRSYLSRFDPASGVLQIAFPIFLDAQPPPEIMIGDELGVSFRRGHKKCVFVAKVLLRQLENLPEGKQVDSLLVRSPKRIRDIQRRCYQRVIVPDGHFVPVRLWMGGLPDDGQPSWPICSGRLANVSLGGTLADIRAEHNPRLSIGDVVGVEITHAPNQPPLTADAQYRHCVTLGPGRMGLGLQFLGLEHDRPGRSDIGVLAYFIKSLRAVGARIDPEE